MERYRSFIPRPLQSICSRWHRTSFPTPDDAIHPKSKQGLAMSIQGQRCHEFDLLVLVAFVTELHTLRLSGRASGTRSLEDTCSRRERDYRCLLQGPRKILQDLERASPLTMEESGQVSISAFVFPSATGEGAIPGSHGYLASPHYPCMP
jgi:hypothetical protein